MHYWHRLREAVRTRSTQLGPGSHLFLKSLSIVTIFFALSKVFSSAATVIMARYLGPAAFGEAQVVLLVSQFLSLFMLFGLHIGVIRYSAGEDNPKPVLSTAIFLSATATVIAGVVFWLFRDVVSRWINFDNTKVQWALLLGALFAAYSMLTSLYQALNLFKARGVIELLFAFILLPGLAIGHLIISRSFETLLIAYAAAYILCLPPMIWRFRGLLSFKHLFAPQTREMLSYGGLALLGNTGYVITFLVQPLQLQQFHGEAEVGLFRLYCAGSVNLATFASTIFYTVFFPKVSASKDKQGIWRRLTAAWMRGGLPVMLLFAGIQIVTVTLSGGEFPLVWGHIVLFAIASTLIAITTTFGQILTAQGLRGMRWSLVTSISSGAINYFLSAMLIPHFGIAGAAIALIGNYMITLLIAIAVRNNTLNSPE